MAKTEKIEKTAKANKKEQKVVKNEKPQKVRRSKIKETFSELKKVNWPSFKKTMQQTGMVISVVVVFMLLVLGIDTLVSHIIRVITNI